MCACATDTRPRVHPCVRACWRVGMGAHVSAPNRASPFCRRRRKGVWLAGVPIGVGVQRKHRRVEHRPRCEHGLGTRRYVLPAARRRRRRRRARPGSDVDVAQPLCAVAPPMRARTCRHSVARASTCVGKAARRRASTHASI